ncbi:glycosyltransferase [bacterium]|nr:glycosyltransferase [bacterium]
MRVVLIHEAQLPVTAYGGTERVVWWLSKGLSEQGLEVTLAALPGTQCEWAEVVYPDFRRPLEPQLPGYDVYQYFNTPEFRPERPYAVNIGGNGRPGERFLPNTVFVSQDHARRHGAECFVHNGLDPSEYVFQERKNRSLLFLAKASWKVKNVTGAQRIARSARWPLEVVGGERWLLKNWRGTQWLGMLGGRPKAEAIARNAGLLFPVLWNEPFGLAVVEALVSGTPVLATPWGSLKELVPAQVGRLCASEREFREAVANLGDFKAKDCRDWALAHFTYTQMAAGYRKLYERVLQGVALNSREPVTQAGEMGLRELPR